jgi:cyanophycinase
MTTIALVGGNEFGPECVPLDRHILGLVPGNQPRVLIVPTAAAHERPEQAGQNGVRYFTALGASATVLTAIKRADWEGDNFLPAVAGADVIYLTGGDPWYLLETIRDTPLFAAILRRCRDSAGLVGSSAGAMVLAEYMRQRSGGWTPGLNVVPGIAVLPHIRSLTESEAQARRAGLPDGVIVLGIEEATGCLLTSEGMREVVGPGQVAVIRKTRMMLFRHGERWMSSTT